MSGANEYVQKASGTSLPSPSPGVVAAPISFTFGVFGRSVGPWKTR